MPDTKFMSRFDRRALNEAVLNAKNSFADPFLGDPRDEPDPATVRLKKIIFNLWKNIPFKKLAIFAKQYENDEVIARLPVYGLVKLSIEIHDPLDGGSVVIAEHAFQLGSLATDHVGYASFDLRPLQNMNNLLVFANEIDPEVEPDNISMSIEYYVLPFGEDQFAIDAIAQGDVSHDMIVLRAHFEAAWLAGRDTDPALPSMQDPGIVDWRLSPGSFALSPARLVGNDDCEDLYPSDLSSHRFSFHQMVSVGGGRSRLRDKHISEYHFGYVFDYRSQWFPVGHSLGRVLYSLPLAPGEKVNLAIIDWQRNDAASRTEDTGFSETLLHDQQRDRMITEIVHSSIREKQKGHSIMGGGASSMVMPVYGGIIGGSMGFGGTKKSSSGSRNIAADTAQDLSDGFHQSSSALRELRSTVVTQAGQTESGRFETRTIANYNHCHTLTILYYEVLQHYRISTSYAGRRPALFVQMQNLIKIKNGNSIIRKTVLAHRAAIEAALLDPNYAGGFDALERVKAGEKRLELEQLRLLQGSPPPPNGSWVFSKYRVIFHTGDNGFDNRALRVKLVTKAGGLIPCRQVAPPPDNNDPEILGTANLDEFEKHTLNVFVIEPQPMLKWEDLRGCRIEFEGDPGNSGLLLDNWKLEKLELFGTTSEGHTGLLIDNQIDRLLKGNDNVEILIKVPDIPSGVAPALVDFVSERDITLAEQFEAHLEHFCKYYAVAAFIGADPVARRDILEQVEIGGQPLSKLVDNIIIANEDDVFAFPLTEFGEAQIRKSLNIKKEDEPLETAILAEDLISIPTKGVFADGKMGHCSTCETIDDTRFWDFQKSPIPGQAPEIAPVSTQSRYQSPQNLAPTNFPASIVNVATPPAAPDPAALEAAMKVLGTPNIFRDMSGGTELANFLTEMVKGTQDMVNQFGKSNRQAQLLEKINDMDGLSPEQKTELSKRALASASGETAKAKAAKTEKAGSAKSADAASGSQTAKKDPEPERTQKPVRPKPQVTDQWKIEIVPEGFIPGVTKPADKVEITLGVQPDGQNMQSFLPHPINVTEFMMPENAHRQGRINITTVIPTDIIFHSVNGDMVSDTIEAEELKAQLHSGLNDLKSIPYELDPNTNLLKAKLKIPFQSIIVEAPTWEEARDKWNQETQGPDRLIISVAGLSTWGEVNPDPTEQRPWIIGYLAEKISFEIIAN